jgi:DNA methylase
VWDVSKIANSAYQHPMQKPLELYSIPLRHHTKVGELVAEPFAGSGTQFVAAHRMNRRCYGMELEPKWADVCLKRIEAEGLTVENMGANASGPVQPPKPKRGRPKAVKGEPVASLPPPVPEPDPDQPTLF